MKTQLLLEKRRYKPLYKRFKQVFENVQLRKKIFKFRKKKWEGFVRRLKSRYSRYWRKYKIFNHSGNYIVQITKFRTRAPSFKKRFRYLMITAKKLTLFYGGLKKKYMKKIVNSIWQKGRKDKTVNKILSNTNIYFLELMEKRLESVLYRSSFANSMRSARQLILHGNVYVNNRIIKHGSYILKKNDLITINKKCHFDVQKNIIYSDFWPFQLERFLVNYRTLQILYIGGDNALNNFSNLFPFGICIRDILNYYKYI